MLTSLSLKGSHSILSSDWLQVGAYQMKRNLKIVFLVPVLLIAVGSVLTGSLAAQALTNLHSLKDREGTNPTGFLVLSDNTLYGTANLGGTANKGSVFALKTDGSAFTNLHSFIGSDGANPYGGVILLRNTLYGTTSGGGSSGNGTVFKVNIDGTGFTILHSFEAGSGSYPNITNRDGTTRLENWRFWAIRCTGRRGMVATSEMARSSL